MKPEDLLPDSMNSVSIGDVTVRKGSVGAFLFNARLLADPAASGPQKDESRAHLIELLPALRALGFFEVFDVRDAELRELIDVAAVSALQPTSARVP